MRESETVKLQQWPTAAQLESWKQAAIDEVVAASNRGRDAFDWINQVEEEVKAKFTK